MHDMLRHKDFYNKHAITHINKEDISHTVLSTTHIEPVINRKYNIITQYILIRT